MGALASLVVLALGCVATFVVRPPDVGIVLTITGTVGLILSLLFWEPFAPFASWRDRDEARPYMNRVRYPSDRPGKRPRSQITCGQGAAPTLMVERIGSMTDSTSLSALIEAERAAEFNLIKEVTSALGTETLVRAIQLNPPIRALVSAVEARVRAEALIAAGDLQIAVSTPVGESLDLEGTVAVQDAYLAFVAAINRPTDVHLGDSERIEK